MLIYARICVQATTLVQNFGDGFVLSVCLVNLTMLRLATVSDPISGADDIRRCAVAELSCRVVGCWKFKSG